jgi:hypothetical protein
MLSWSGLDLHGDAHVGTDALGGSAEQSSAPDRESLKEK